MRMMMVISMVMRMMMTRAIKLVRPIITIWSAVTPENKFLSNLRFSYHRLIFVLPFHFIFIPIMTIICHLTIFIIRMPFPIIIMIMNMMIIKEFLVEAEIQAPPSHCHWSAAHTAVQVE